jgi:hypothetical protein
MRHAFAAATLVLGWAASATGGEPLAVHVAGATAKSSSKAVQHERYEKKETLRASYDELDESYRKQYGKKVETWPDDKREDLLAARDAFLEAQTDWFYSIDLKQKDIDDSVRELTEALEKTGTTVVDGPADADLLVEVLGRAKVTHDGWGGGMGMKTSAAQIVLRVAPGGRMDTVRLARSDAAWDQRHSFWKKSDTSVVHRFTKDAPYWLLISTKPGAAFMASYKGVARQAAEAIEKFGVENADKIEGARRKKS